jgi:hypothetical protein
MSERRHLQIATTITCPARWDAMTGSEAVRHCGTCRKNVYNLSEMSESEVDALLASAEERCVRFYYRPDGTIVSSRCSDARRVAPASAALGVAASLATLSALSVALPEQPAAVEQIGDVRVAMGGMRLNIKVPVKRRPVADVPPTLAPPPPKLEVPAFLTQAPVSSPSHGVTWLAALGALLAGIVAFLLAGRVPATTRRDDP